MDDVGDDRQRQEELMMTAQGGIAVIFWGPHSLDTEQWAKRLGAAFYTIHYLRWKRPWLAPIKYIPMWFKTWAVLLKQRPSAVFVVNTPVFAPLCVYTYCRMAGIPYVMNIHGHSFTGWRWGWSRPLLAALARRARVNLVGFPEYKRLCESWGARALVLGDTPIQIKSPGAAAAPLPGPSNVTVISTFAPDEPVDLVAEAARRLPQVCCTILGDTTLADKRLLTSAPDNVTFPGYIKGDAYWNLLRSSQAIMTLTTNQDSLVAGGLDGMYLGKPLILSRQRVLVDYFSKGAVFVDHTVEGIVSGIQQALEHQRTLAVASSELAGEKRARWERTFNEFLGMLGEADA
jgi:hypothetical protein